jgi:molybdopterin converting factor small subunit
MEVTVRFTGLLHSLAARGSLELSLKEGATLGDALTALRDQVPPAFTERVLSPMTRGESPAALLLLNRTLVAPSGVQDRPLVDGDILAFVTPADGG